MILTGKDLFNRQRTAKGKLLVIAAVVALFPVIIWPQSVPQARQIMERIYQQDSSRDRVVRATMDAVDAKGKVRHKRFVMYKQGPPGNSKTLLRFTGPPEVRGVSLLSMNTQGTGERQWLYTPAVPRVRRIAPQERSRRLLGTDFTHEDLLERILDDYTYRIISDNEVLNGRRTFKIEARPVQPARSGFAFIYLWAAKDIPLVLYSESYDQRDRRVRASEAAQTENIAGIWVARRVTVTSLLEKTHTVLRIEEVRFNTGLRDDMFTLDALEKAEFQ